jgi:hypothetical protein
VQQGAAPHPVPEEPPVPGGDLRAWASALTGWLARLRRTFATEASVDAKIAAAIRKHLEAEHP